MSSTTFVSYAQNGEDVVLFRTLGAVSNGRYVDVGANDPVVHSVSYAFYQRGWCGITIDPVHAFAERQRAERPRDQVIEAAISDDPTGSVTLHQIADTGLSTLLDDVSDDHRGAGWDVQDVTVPTRKLDDLLLDAGWQGLDIHFIVIDTEGAEQTVLKTLDLRRWRPWVMIVEATRPLTTELTHHTWEPMLTEAGYRFCLFDGLSRFYLADEKWDQFHTVLGAPASVLDNYISHHDSIREQEAARLLKAATDLTADRDRLEVELEHARAAKHRHDEQNTAAILKWRKSAIQAWAQAARIDQSQHIQTLNQQIALHLNHITHVDDQLSRTERELTAIQHTLSWRITKPLRRVRTLNRRTKP